MLILLYGRGGLSMKKMFLFLILMILFVSNVNAEACDAYDIKRLKHSNFFKNENLIRLTND